MTRDEVKALSDEDLRIKVAELLGWTDLGIGNDCVNGKTVENLVGYPPKNTPGDYWTGVPDYPNDLNAVFADIEGPLHEQDMYEEYVGILVRLDWGHTTAMVKAAQADARARCEAFVTLMTNGRK